ncbi:hypothetical protein VII00023_19459 [Vibrio ichthyoenteri ATCC 700023]|uniref:DUF72 domain-containing protein n=1 Tax=Vibrio ichthyoenteri ATCC 700023 TaxID=870968 RepID=F9S3C2_9VIBR|nr:DUF72 domain-containing protein [Vibrio ichthyoenteri]EGU38146.1 hypothetical protein VII00023_19459 [Vibrio ichthyoenteri ATCC 700023]
MTSLPIRLGLTMWSHNQWQKSFYGSGTKPAERLEKYTQVFHTVEGNTTFYATPNAHTVRNWYAASHDNFKFTFKLPQSITHQQMLKGCQAQLKEFMQVMAPLHERIGQWTIQLPAAFTPADLPTLQKFCALFPPNFPLGVEVRHLGFFAKNDDEKRFNQWLIESGIDRIIMDSRPLFSALPDNEVVIDAQKKKPRVPVHAISTANHPMIRFIGHPDLAANAALFKPWLAKLPEWVKQGKQPYLMVHTPDNVFAPELAQTLYQQLQSHISLPELSVFPSLSSENNNHDQLTMF